MKRSRSVHSEGTETNSGVYGVLSDSITFDLFFNSPLLAKDIRDFSIFGIV